MKKITLVLAVLLAAAPALATINISAVDEGSGVVRIDYDASGHGQLPRAFALDITVDAGTIDDVTNFFIGECNDSNGFGIFPASFARYIDADDPNWADANYTPVAELGDLPSDTQPGLVPDSNGVTIEMGSLYAAPKGPPESSGTLCKVTVSASCNLTVNGNVGRGEVVNEDTTQATTNLPITIPVTVVVVCTVPDVVGMTQANAEAAIVTAGFVASATSGHDCAVTAGNVISQNPIDGGATATCGSTVNIVVADGDTIVPNVVGDTSAVAQAAIIAAGLTVGNITTACSDTVAAGNVISQTPIDGGATATCGSTVDIVISDGQPTVPNVLDMNKADAIAAINAVAYISAGTVTCECNDVEASDEVLRQIPGAGVAPCGTTVDIVVSACLGEVTGDCEVSMADARKITDWVNAYGEGRPLAIASTEPEYVLCGDVNVDGEISMADYRKIVDWVNAHGSGRPLSFPCPHSHP